MLLLCSFLLKITPTCSAKIEEFPLLRIGILTLPIHKALLKSISEKYTANTFSNFVVNTMRPEDLQLSEDSRPSVRSLIKAALERPNDRSIVNTAYIKNLRQFRNVKIKVVNILQDILEITKIMDQLDGFFITGGSTPLMEDNPSLKIQKLSLDGQAVDMPNRIPTKYLQTVFKIVSYAKTINDRGKEFPLWGTCWGFEAMLISEANKGFQLDNFVDIKNQHSIKIINSNSGDQQLSISVQSEAIKVKDQSSGNIGNFWTEKSKYRNYPEKFEDFHQTNFLSKQSKDYFYFYHHFGITPASFFKDPVLPTTVDVLSISDQENFSNEAFGKLTFPMEADQLKKCSLPATSFIASFQFKKYPFYGVQFHPEKPLFDYRNNDTVDHSKETAVMNLKFSKFFIYNMRRAKLRNRLKGIHNSRLAKELFVKRKFKVSQVLLYEEINVY